MILVTSDEIDLEELELALPRPDPDDGDNWYRLLASNIVTGTMNRKFIVNTYELVDVNSLDVSPGGGGASRFVR